MSATRPPLLEIRNLSTHFFTDAGVVRAVDDVSYDVLEGETLGLVGESGCGKSVTAMSVLRLIPDPPGRIVGGSIRFEGRDLVSLPADELRTVRGRKISMIFQEPMTSLNPVFTAGEQIVEALELHTDLDGDEAEARAVEMLRTVGIPDPARRFGDYPHQLSGGMKQRVMIAMALCTRPRLLIADEPTTALDVTVRAQFHDLLRSLQEQSGMSILLITHDLGVVAETAHRVVVMYASRVVESADVRELFARPRHPYTLGLFRSLPRVDRDEARLEPIPGQVPMPWAHPPGCTFHPRCAWRQPLCEREAPPLVPVAGEGHLARCWLNDRSRVPGGWPL